MPQTNNINSLVSKVQDASIVIFKVSFIYPTLREYAELSIMPSLSVSTKTKEACITYSVGYAKALHCPSSKG